MTNGETLEASPNGGYEAHEPFRPYEPPAGNGGNGGGAWQGYALAVLMTFLATTVSLYFTIGRSFVTDKEVRQIVADQQSGMAAKVDQAAADVRSIRDTVGDLRAQMAAGNRSLDYLQKAMDELRTQPPRR